MKASKVFRILKKYLKKLKMCIFVKEICVFVSEIFLEILNFWNDIYFFGTSFLLNENMVVKFVF